MNISPRYLTNIENNGQLVQRGTHNKLLTQDGIYRHFITGHEQAIGWKL